MSGRCIECNNKLLEQDMKKKIFNPVTQLWEYNIFCNKCTPKELLIIQQKKEEELYEEDQNI